MTATLSEFDSLVARMVEMKIPRERAVIAARLELGIQPVSQLEQLRRDAEIDEDEDEVLEEADRLMRALGFVVIRLSQKRRSKITEGVPDRRYYHPRRRLKLWLEGKSSSGRQRPAQREFQLLCDATDDPYVLGGLEPLRAWLTANQVATFDESGLPNPIPHANA